jgi:hypothetical protein
MCPCAGEIAARTLDDMVWRTGEMLVHAKGRQRAGMPIPQTSAQPSLPTCVMDDPSRRVADCFCARRHPTSVLRRAARFSNCDARWVSTRLSKHPAASTSCPTALLSSSWSTPLQHASLPTYIELHVAPTAEMRRRRKALTRAPRFMQGIASG